MIIAVNATAAHHGTSGFVHATELLRALVALGSEHRFVAITTAAQQPFRDGMPAGVDHLVLAHAPDGGLQRTAWLQWRLPALLRSARVDLLYNKGNFHLFRNTIRQVCLLENANPFSPLALPSPASARLRNRLLRLMSTAALRRAAAVIFPSDTARRVVLAQTRAGTRTAVIPHGWTRIAPEPVDAAADQPYLLAVSSMFPHRNLLVAVDALSQLHARGSFRGRLVIVGGAPGPYRDRFLAQVAAKGMSRHVRVVPPVSPGRVMAYYHGAVAAVMPSIEETFGIPLIEAMAAGVPVAAARVTGADAGKYFIPFEEIAGDAAEYFNPFDASSVADAVERTLGDPRRRELISRGRARAHDYSWANSARRTLALLESIGGTRR